MEATPGIFDVYHIRDWGDGKKSQWTRVGVGFRNRDDSINIRLDLLPIDGKVQLRNRSEKNNNKKGEKP